MGLLDAGDQHALIGSAVIIAVVVTVGIVVLKRQRGPWTRMVSSTVTQLDEHERYGRSMAGRIAALEDGLAVVSEQQQVEVRYRRLLMATWEQAFRAAGEEPPADLVTAAAERPKLRVIKGGVA